MSPVPRAATLIRYRTHVRFSKFIVSPHAREVNKNFHFLEKLEHENSGGTPAKMTPTA